MPSEAEFMRLARLECIFGATVKYLPSPFIGPTDHLKGIAWCWQVRQQVTKGLLTAVPADDQPQAQGAPVDLPLHHEFYPLAFGEFGVDGLERLVAQRAQPFPVFAKRLEHLRIHPGFGPDDKEAALILQALEIV